MLAEQQYPKYPWDGKCWAAVINTYFKVSGVKEVVGLEWVPDVEQLHKRFRPAGLVSGLYVVAERSDSDRGEYLHVYTPTSRRKGAMHLPVDTFCEWTKGRVY